jgi:hypothetical protein
MHKFPKDRSTCQERQYSCLDDGLSRAGFCAQTAVGVERAALLKKLKELKQRCRLEARRQWLEWRLKLEENTSERLQENEQNLMVASVPPSKLLEGRACFLKVRLSCTVDPMSVW